MTCSIYTGTINTVHFDKIAKKMAVILFEVNLIEIQSYIELE